MFANDSFVWSLVVIMFGETTEQWTWKKKQSHLTHNCVITPATGVESIQLTLYFLMHIVSLAGRPVSRLASTLLYRNALIYSHLLRMGKANDLVPNPLLIPLLLIAI